MPRHSPAHGLSGHSKSVLDKVEEMKDDKVASPARSALLHASSAVAAIKKSKKSKAHAEIQMAEKDEKRAMKKSAARDDSVKVTEALKDAVKTLDKTDAAYSSRSPSSKLVSETNKANTDTRQAYHAVLSDVTGSPIGHSKAAKAKRARKSKSPKSEKSPKKPRVLSAYNVHMSKCLKKLKSVSGMEQKEKFAGCVDEWRSK